MNLFPECGDFEMFRTSAIIYSGDDGWRALGETKNGIFIPKAPWLASKDGLRNYIQHWIDLANDQLRNSGACFMIGPPKYVPVVNTALNSVDCSDSAAADAFAKQPEN